MNSDTPFLSEDSGTSYWAHIATRLVNISWNRMWSLLAVLAPRGTSCVPRTQRGHKNRGATFSRKDHSNQYKKDYPSRSIESVDCNLFVVAVWTAGLPNFDHRATQATFGNGHASRPSEKPLQQGLHATDSSSSIPARIRFR